MNTRLILVIVVVSIVGAIGFGSFLVKETPDVTKVPDYNVTLGYIAGTIQALPEDEFLVSLAEKDINEYCKANEIAWRFNFDIKSAEGQAQKAYEYTGEFAENGVKLVGGYAWSSFLCSGARNIAQENREHSHLRR